MPPLERQVLQAALILVAAPLAGGALIEAGAYIAGVVVFIVAMVIALVWAVMAMVTGVRDGRTSIFDMNVDRSPRTAWPPRITRLSAGVFVVWSLLVGEALIATLDSLRTEGFDGLNNLFQIPFALPWFVMWLVIPIGGIWSYEIDAWITAGMGWFNGLLILMFLPACVARRSERPGPA